MFPTPGANICLSLKSHSAMTANNVKYLSFHHNLVAHSGCNNPKLIDSDFVDIRDNVFFDFFWGVVIDNSYTFQYSVGGGVNLMSNAFLSSRDNIDQSIFSPLMIVSDSKLEAKVTNNFISGLGHVDDAVDLYGSWDDNTRHLYRSFGLSFVDKLQGRANFDGGVQEFYEIVQGNYSFLDSIGVIPHGITTSRIVRETKEQLGWLGRKNDPPITDLTQQQKTEFEKTPRVLGNVSNSVLKYDKKDMDPEEVQTMLSVVTENKLHLGESITHIKPVKYTLTVINGCAHNNSLQASAADPPPPNSTNTYDLLPSQPVILRASRLQVHQKFLGWQGYIDLAQNPDKVYTKFLMPEASVNITAVISPI